jgi:hypothetical protein
MTTFTGGCQCGHVRFRVTKPLGRASICHCRMCQKAFGNFFAPLVSTEPGSVIWTKAEPKRFLSSNLVRRGFCPECGTPLTYEAPDGLALAIATFDEPAAIRPEIQYGSEAVLPCVAELAGLPAYRTEDDLGEAPFLASIISYQHPDHET